MNLTMKFVMFFPSKHVVAAKAVLDYED